LALSWAVGALFVQTAALAVISALMIYFDFTREVTTARMALSVTGYLVMMTVLFGLVAVALRRRRRWARGPAIVLELLQVPIGYQMAFGGGSLFGLPVLVLALVAAGLLLAPATRLELSR
jgi:hypothetical protein